MAHHQPAVAPHPLDALLLAGRVPSRQDLAAAAVREALLDVVWSNVEIPRAMAGQVAIGSAVAAYSKKEGSERILVGSEMRPRWPEAGLALDSATLLAEYGVADLDRSAPALFEFLRSHALRQYGHYLYSDADMPKMAKMAVDAGADPAVFGLLETIRIDRRMGIALGREFCWEGYYPKSEADRLPCAQRPLFHWAREGWLHPAEGLAPAAHDELANFYGRLVGASGSREVVDLAIEWKDRLFPKLFAPPPPPASEPGGQPPPTPGGQAGPSEGSENPSSPDGSDGADSSPKPDGGGEGGDGASKEPAQSPADESDHGQPGDSEHSDGPKGSQADDQSGNGQPNGKSESEPPDSPADGEAFDSPGQGSPGAGSKESKESKESHNQAGVGEPGAETAKESSPDGSQPHRSDTDPYGASKEPQPGDSGMLSHILSGQAQDAHAAAEDAADAAANSGVRGAARGPNPGCVHVPAPTAAQAAEARAGHGYGKGEGQADNPPDPGEWNASPSNPDMLEGSVDLFAQGHFAREPSLDKALSLRARRVLERMLTGQTRSTLSDSPAKRMSTRHLAQGLVKYARKDDFSRGAMHLDMVVDCSGSMSGQPMDSAKALVLALSDLAAKGLVHGRIILSSGAGWMACPLPMKEDKIARICAFSGSEGIEPALTKNARRLREADAVFVFTDAQITDRAFSKDELKARKVEPMGLYVGSDSADKLMAQYFDRHLIRPTLEDLCAGMVQRFLSQKKLVASTQQKKARLRR